MENTKIRIVLASHGQQSKGMLDTVQMLLGEQDNIVALSLLPSMTAQDLEAELRKEVEKYGAENIIFMTELLYGSPFNAVVALTRDYDVYHVTGTNLAMLMAVILGRSEESATPAELCDAALEAAADSIQDVRKMLMNMDDDDE